MEKPGQIPHSLLIILVSLSLALAPLSIMPAPVFAQDANAESESLFATALTLNSDVVALLDRASFPHVPRRGLHGLPSSAELAALQNRMAVLHDKLKRLTPLIAKITDAEAEAESFREIGAFYGAAERLEGLKILLGQKVDLSTWTAQYGLDLPLQQLSQLNFVKTAALLAKTYTELPGEELSAEGTAARNSFSYSVNMNLQNSNLELRLEPKFFERYEYQVYLNQLAMKTALKFAVNFSAHRLYDSLALNRQLLGATPESMPELPVYWGENFPSLKVKRQQLTFDYRQKYIREQKVALLEALSTAAKELEKEQNFYSLDETFYRSLLAQANLDQNIALDLTGIRRNELSAWSLAIRSLVNLWNLDQASTQLATIVFQAKRLSLRWLILANPQFTDKLSDEAASEISKSIDKLANDFAQKITSNAQLKSEVVRILDVLPKQIWSKARQGLQNSIKTAALRMKNIASQDINIRYLLLAQRGAIEALNPSPLVKATADGLEQQNSYVEAYLTYRLSLATLLEGYSLPSPVSTNLKLDDLYEIRKKIRWNPLLLTESVPQKYLNALTADPKARAKDLEDILEVGRILKFNVFEKLKPEAIGDPNHRRLVLRPNAENLGLKDNWFSAVIGSERQAYVDEVHKDILNNAPLLGSIVHSGNRDQRPREITPLWEYLAAGHLTAEQEFDLVSRQLRAVHVKTVATAESLQRESKKLDATGENSLAGVGEEIRTLVTRSSQIGLGLSAFSGFKANYDEIRNELMTPSFARQEWQAFTTWSNEVSIYLIGFFVTQMFASRIAIVGKVSDQITKLLAPIFGPNLSRLQPIFLSMAGITIADAAYRGWGPEATRAEILKKYFECGTAAPCVVLYSDVSRQESLRNSARLEAVATVGFLAAIIGGFWLGNKLISRYSGGLSTSQSKTLRSDLETLGLNENSPLTDRVVQEALRNTIQKAKVVSDPVMSAVAEKFARQAHLRIERAVWTEAARWNKFDERFRPSLEKLGLNPREWKNMNSLGGALDNVENQFARGAISTLEYHELKGNLLAISQTLRPTWSKMDADPMLRNFLERVWNTTSGSSSSQIAASRQFFDQRISNRFVAEAEKFYHLSHGRPSIVDRVLRPRAPETSSRTQRFERLLESMMKEAQQRPEVARDTLQRLHDLSTRVGP